MKSYVAYNNAYTFWPLGERYSIFQISTKDLIEVRLDVLRPPPST